MLDPKQTHVHAQWKYPAPMIACRFHPDGKTIFSSAENYKLQRWDFATGKFVEWDAHDGWVQKLLVTADGKTLISAGTDDTLAFWPTTWDGEKPEPLRTVKAHAGWIRAIDPSPDGKLLASGGNDRLVKLWDVATGELVRQFEGHERDVYSTRFHPDGKLLLSGDLDGVVRIREVDSGKEVGQLDAKDLHTYNSGQQVHYGGVRDICFDAKAERVYCVGLHKATNPLGAVNEPLLLEFDWAGWGLLTKMVTSGKRAIGWRVVPLSDGSLLVGSGGSGGGFLSFWKPGTPKPDEAKTDEAKAGEGKADEAKPAEEKAYHDFKMPNSVRAMDLHPDGLHVVTADADKQLRIARLAKKAEG